MSASHNSLVPDERHDLGEYYTPDWQSARRSVQQLAQLEPETLPPPRPLEVERERRTEAANGAPERRGNGRGRGAATRSQGGRPERGQRRLGVTRRKRLRLGGHARILAANR